MKLYESMRNEDDKDIWFTTIPTSIYSRQGKNSQGVVLYRVRRLTKNKSYQDKAQDIQGGMIHFLVLAFARHGLSQKIVSLELRIEDPEINSKPSTPKP